MFTTNTIMSVIRCPNCKGLLSVKVVSEDDLGIREGELDCPACNRVYPVREGILHLQPRDEITTASKDWSLRSFDDAYRRVGGEQSNIEWGDKIGIPRAISQYDHPRVKGRLLEWLGPPDNGMVLDVGAGSGYFIFEMMGACTAKDLSFVGTDPSFEHIKWLERRRREEKNKSVLTVVGDGRSLPFADCVFDVVVSSEVLEHIPAKREAIQEMARCLKTGGVLLLSTPSKNAFDFWDFVSAPLRWALRTRGPNAAYDRPIRPRDLRSLLEEVGLAPEHFELNVLIPPQSYFARLPKFSASIIAEFCGRVESSRHLKRLLESRFALHIVLCARRIDRDTGTPPSTPQG